jgi:hypothetical protein
VCDDVAHAQEELCEGHAALLKLLTHAQALTADLKLRRMATFLTVRVLRCCCAAAVLLLTARAFELLTGC